MRGTTPRWFAQAVDANILRLCATAGGPPPEASPLGLKARPDGLAELGGSAAAVGGFEISRQGDGVVIAAAGQTVLHVTGVTLTPVDLVRHDTGGAPPEITTVTTVDGQRSAIANLVPRVVGQAYRADLVFAPAEDEGLYGLGQDEDGGFNRRGTKLHLYQHNMRTPMPCLVSDRGYGLLIDCASLMVFDDTGPQTRWTLEAVQALDCYLVTGGVAAAVRGFRRLTGRAVLLPKWAFGYLQSKERYSSAGELLAVAQRYRDLGVPLDCVVQDWATWPEGEWGQKTPDPARYPDLPGLKAALHQLDVHSLVSIWPNMAVGTADHAEFAEADLLLADYSTYDALDATARDLYWRQLRDGLRAGFDGWWSDSTEPFSIPDWGGPVRRGEDERYQLVGGEHVRFLGAEQANGFALAHARGLAEHELAEQDRVGEPSRRLVNLTRSGYPGIQRYGGVLWSGDVSATWTALKAEIAKAIAVGLSGVPWWTTDAGGFFAGGTACWRRWCGDPAAEPVWFWAGDYDDGVANPGYRELYTRWLQFAALLPLCRSHGTDTPREVWQFGQPGEPFYEAVAAAIRLRYRLLPYLYTVAAETVLFNASMVRALLFDYAGDAVARGIADQFLVGENLLVCPVTEPAFYGRDGQPLAGASAARRSCYLPAGRRWADFWSGELREGGQHDSVAAPLDRLPLFVRAGSVVPLQGPVQHALENRDRFEIVIFPGADGGGRLYDDDGLSRDYLSGRYSLVEFGWDDESRRLQIHARAWRRARPMTLTVRVGEWSRDIEFTGHGLVVDCEEG
jgi:alpha-D-xyloside xylohydrolase